MAILHSDKLKFPTTGTYDGTKEPLEHLKNYKGWMDLYVYIDTIRYQAFQLTFSDKATAWYWTLKPSDE